ncbi:MAG: pyridoxamine 5'-phosphate oxidase family protein [Solirubrobacteraceae bacterium]|nr:pyridoxamine 5'-phosphate oxidase family protein [Solirubrobacteraceae bacterium]MDP4921082.1 pyridoxamine 5'-phosphate oxidase family protein [Solirubrobacteraceae bacterium]
MDEQLDLPHWPPGTVCILATGGDGPHAIPVSTAVRASGDRIVLALGARRGSLSRLREDPRVALTVLAAGDVAFTAHGTARVVEEPLPGIDGVIGVEINVERVSSHKRPTFSIADGVAWAWADDEARERDAAVRRALIAL